MVTHANPKVSQRAIAAALRRYRRRAGVTLEEAAKAADYDAGSLSRAELCKVTPHPAIVRALLEFYGETDPAVLDNHAALAKHGRKRGWWNQYSDLMPVAYIGLEGAATKICSLENQLVPGLLQIDAYTRALMAAEAENTSEEEVERRLKLRNERKDILVREDNPCELWAIVDESVLHRPVGSRAVMAEQIEHLLTVSTLSNVTLQVLPFDAGAHGSLGSRFVILQFADPLDPGAVYVEQVHLRDEFVEKPEQVQVFVNAFGRLQASAETPTRSRAMLEKAKKALGQELPC